MKELRFKNKEALARTFIAHLKRVVSDKSGIFNLALSGGSTPDALFNQLRAETDKSWLDRIHFYWGDERFVPWNDTESNYGRAKLLFLDPCKIDPLHVHPIPILETPELSAQHYIQELAAVPQFDLIILGIGDDGHTASIFPHEIHLWDSEKTCEIATHPISGQVRISITGQVINSAHEVCVLAAGKSKCKILNLIKLEAEEVAKLPASLINPSSAHLTWYMVQ